MAIKYDLLFFVKEKDHTPVIFVTTVTKPNKLLQTILLQFMKERSPFNVRYVKDPFQKGGI